MTAFAVAIAFWVAAGASPSSCVAVRLVELPAPVLGRARLGGCRIEIARRLVPARTRRQALRLCWVTVHEVGHTLGLEHARRGIMRPRYRAGRHDEPGACWAMALPASCVVCDGRDPQRARRAF